MNWAEVKNWRKAARAELIATRLAEPAASRALRGTALSAHLRALLTDLAQPISAYWPIRGEPDLRALLEDLDRHGLALALPVALSLGEALRFRTWRPGQALEHGIWNIPIPAATVEVQPAIVLAPVVGFDHGGYRLGYGGGFFDRTLIALDPRPLAVGIAYAAARIATVHPQPHDVPMDFIVTEYGILRAAEGRLESLTASAARTVAVALATARGVLRSTAAAYASPACAAGEFPNY